jgi:hypothetical protein
MNMIIWPLMTYTDVLWAIISKGHKQESQNHLKTPMPEGGEA